MSWIVCVGLWVASLPSDAPAPPPDAPPDARLDLNAADFDALVALPGVGPVRAERILARRNRRPFRRVRELLRIRGIGPRRYQRLKALVRVIAKPPLPKKTKRSAARVARATSRPWRRTACALKHGPGPGAAP